MTAEQFTYWLQGFAELNGSDAPNVEQWASIRDHLGAVFNKVTPDRVVHTRHDTPGITLLTAEPKFC